jgi:DNA repair protein RadA/Sms
MLSDSDGEDDAQEFIATGGWDPCFGRLVHDDGSFTYGIPRQSVTLLGGKNGAGKSTLVLQICERILGQYPDKQVLIVSVEEAKKQVRRLGKRLKLKHMNRIGVSKGEVDLDIIMHARKPELVIVDSLPRLCPDLASSVEFCKRLKEHIEALNIPAIVINHINKEEEFAGLEALQHEVDATLIFTVFEDGLRSLRSLKNRNGLPAEVFFDMTDTGLLVNDDEEEDEDDED